MLRAFVAGALGLVLFAASVLAFEAVGTIKKVDADQGILYIHANGQDRTVKVAKDVKVLGTDGKELAGGLRAKELKEGAEVTVTVEREEGGPVIHAIRLGRQAARGGNPQGGKTSYGLKPLTEMTAQDRYKGEDGGLYGGGKNEPPSTLREAARKATANIVPRNAAGEPAPDGLIGLVSISMSNATQVYSVFKKIA